MKIGESESELAIYDSLISGLADHAVSSTATSESYFAKMTEVIDAIFAPSWSAALAKGPGDSPVPICSTPGAKEKLGELFSGCLLYTSPSPRDGLLSRMPSSA